MQIYATQLARAGQRCPTEAAVNLFVQSSASFSSASLSVRSDDDNEDDAPPRSFLFFFPSCRGHASDLTGGKSTRTVRPLDLRDKRSEQAGRDNTRQAFSRSEPLSLTVALSLSRLPISGLPFPNSGRAKARESSHRGQVSQVCAAVPAGDAGLVLAPAARTTTDRFPRASPLREWREGTRSEGGRRLLAPGEDRWRRKRTCSTHVPAETSSR
ncbi:hypothetical protein MRX96_047871 [Rhipicephalus microplus]